MKLLIAAERTHITDEYIHITRDIVQSGSSRSRALAGGEDQAFRAEVWCEQVHVQDKLPFRHSPPAMAVLYRRCCILLLACLLATKSLAHPFYPGCDMDSSSGQNAHGLKSSGDGGFSIEARTPEPCVAIASEARARELNIH